METPGQGAQYPQLPNSNSPSKCDSSVSHVQHGNPQAVITTAGSSATPTSIHYQPIQANVSLYTVCTLTFLLYHDQFYCV